MQMLHTKRRLRRLYRMAHALIMENKHEEAWPTVTEMLTIDMDDVGGLYLCGIVLRERGYVGAAAQMFRRAVALDPQPLNLWLHFAACLHDCHEYDAALQIWNMLDKKNPNDHAVLRNRATTYLNQGKFHDSLNDINRAIELVDHPAKGAMAIKGMAALALERWKEGFTAYCGMYGEELVIRKYCLPEEPEWDGTPGKTVVVQGDQGIGDEIRFASVLPDLARDCKVIFDCHPKLEHVMRRSFPNITVHGTRKSKVAPWVLEDNGIDASHHISGLGRYYRHKDSDFPRVPYLIPDEEKRAYWREQLEDMPKPWVGIAWQGGMHKTQRENRSFDLATFIPIIQEGGTFVDLSYHDSGPEVEYFNSMSENKVVRFDIDTEDYDNTLALIAELDLVICVPTTVMHACGAIGKPCLVFNPSFPHWEFGKRDDMIWYEPGLVRVFRGQIEDVRDAYLEQISGMQWGKGGEIRKTAAAAHIDKPKVHF